STASAGVTRNSANVLRNGPTCQTFVPRVPARRLPRQGPAGARRTARSAARSRGGKRSAPATSIVVPRSSPTTSSGAGAGSVAKSASRSGRLRRASARASTVLAPVAPASATRAMPAWARPTVAGTLETRAAPVKQRSARSLQQDGLPLGQRRDGERRRDARRAGIQRPVGHEESWVSEHLAAVIDDA